MMYLGIHTECELKNRFKADRFKKFFIGSKKVHGKLVKYYEILEDDAPAPVRITRNNIKQYHNFFTQYNVI